MVCSDVFARVMVACSGGMAAHGSEREGRQRLAATAMSVQMTSALLIKCPRCRRRPACVWRCVYVHAWCAYRSVRVRFGLLCVIAHANFAQKKCFTEGRFRRGGKKHTPKLVFRGNYIRDVAHVIYGIYRYSIIYI